ncbi:RNA polymerase sigma factor [Corallococcus aberystwythensis]|uniref:Sigma-70 family RNA polymerase sigma factor n=1 Tax=Corallococcus aberystwythensis TaxID=2316722 RepID=A0A3A8QFT8_9BACT|nr:sigma-70 family RNA polymerase sigma factor [Corallococcus aberystwythensis]RKH67579.1 sigma-70 family RNA polymerase sigma factor [Corallococcus aberystwythensis]
MSASEKQKPSHVAFGSPADDGRVAALLSNQATFLSFLERRVGRRDVAEDLFQEVLARSIGRLDTLRSEEAAVAWFYRSLRNAVVDHYRRQGSSARALESLARELEGDAATPEVRHAVCECVGRLVGSLKPEYAAALQRIEVEGASVKGFAEEAGITANNAAVRVHRARTALLQKVEAACGRCAQEGCRDCSCGR